MDAVVIVIVVLGVLAVGGCAAAVWLAALRGRAAAEAAGERARAEGAEREREALRGETSRMEGLLSEARGTTARLGEQRATLEAQLCAERESHLSQQKAAEAQHQVSVRELEERLTAEIAHAEKIAQAKLDSVEREKKAIQEHLSHTEARFRDVFGNLAGEALKANREQFLTLAEQKLEAKRGAVDELVKPIAETLKRTDEKLAVIEAAGVELKSETGRLVRALRDPHVRGRYGEIQLRRVAELAGMSAYCDFAEQDQTAVRGADGGALRPDMIVRMPSSRTVVVDAKTNIQAYMDAMSAGTPEEAEKHLERFARHVSDQAAALSKKKYWAQYDGSPEFVVMFIPGDQFVDAALRRQPELLERAAEQGVIMASPSTLIGLLRAVAVGYKEEQLAHAAEELRELGKELHERVATAMSHAVKIGKNLGQAVDAYNDFVGSYEKRLEPVMRKFEESGVKSGKELPETPVLGVAVRNGARLLDGSAPAGVSESTGA